MGRYTVHLVGESNFQAAIRAIRAGAPVKLLPEPDNPHDARAVKAVSGGTDTIGYLERDSWLTRAMLDDGTQVASRVHEILGGVPGQPTLGVVLEVLTAADAQAALSGQTVQAPTSGPPPKSKRGCGFYALVGLGVFIGLGVLGAIISPPKPNPSLSPLASGAGSEAAAAANVSEPVSNDPGISSAEFAQIRNGMTYEQVQQIVGSSGELLSDSEIAGIHTFAVKWDGERGFGANANLMFQNNRLIMKAQFGLQ